MLEKAEYKNMYFIEEYEKVTLKTYEQFSLDTGQNFVPGRRYLENKKLDDIPFLYPRRKGTPEEQQLEHKKRLSLLDLLSGLLKLDPEERLTPEQAILHPFV